MTMFTLLNVLGSPVFMFTINSELLKKTVGALSKSARKTLTKDPNVYIRTADGMISMYYANRALSVERLVAADVQAELVATTSLYLLDTLVSGLPKQENIVVQLNNNQIEMKWGKRGSKISVPVETELMAMNAPPSNVETIEWAPGTLHGIVQLLAPYCLPISVEKTTDKGMLLGIQFVNDGGEVYLRAAGETQYICRRGKMAWFEDLRAISLNAAVLNSITEVIPSDVPITVGRSKHGLITFKTGTVTCVTAPLVATLPENLVKTFDATMQKDFAMKVYMDRLETIELMRRVKIVTQASKSYVVFEFKDDKISCFTIGRELVQEVGGTYSGNVGAIALSASQLELAASSYLQNKDGTGELILGFDSFKSHVAVSFDGEERTKIMITPIAITEVANLNSASAVATP